MNAPSANPPRLRLRLRPDAAVTLPDEIHAALRLDPGDELEAEVAGDSVVLRKAALGRPTPRGFAELRAGLRPTAGQAEKPLDEQEAEILAVVDEARRELADARRRR